MDAIFLPGERVSQFLPFLIMPEIIVCQEYFIYDFSRMLGYIKISLEYSWNEKTE